MSLSPEQLDTHTRTAIAWVNAGKPSRWTTAKRITKWALFVAGVISVMYPFHCNRFI